MAEEGIVAPYAVIRPVPDPTSLTTAQLDRGLASLREIIEARLNGMDKALELLQEITNKFPSFVNDKVENLYALHEVKFNSIQTQFSERDTRTEQTSRDSKVAVDAALQAAKEAVGAQNTASSTAIAKSETATQKQIDQIVTLLQTSVGAINDKIEDLKSRFSLIEGRTAGITSAESSKQASASGVVGIIGLIIGALIGIGGILVAVFAGGKG